MKESHTVKQLPPDFINCSRDDLIILISRMLNSLVSINNNYGNDDIDSISPDNLTRFHSRTPPSISVYSYLARLARYSSLENAVLLTAVYYIDLLSTVYRPFTLNSLTVHRFLLTATTVGSKGLCDSFCTNSHYAKVGGIQANELDILEREFLAKVNFRILPRDLNIENCANDKKIATNEGRKRSITTLESEKNRNHKESADDSKKNINKSNINTSHNTINSSNQLSQHELVNGGYNVLDLYYKKMIALIGNETSIDDPTIAQSFTYTINDDYPSYNETRSQIKTSPDTLSDDKYQQAISNLLKNLTTNETKNKDNQRRPIQSSTLTKRNTSKPAFVSKNDDLATDSPKNCYSPLKRPIQSDSELHTPPVKKTNAQ